MTNPLNRETMKASDVIRAMQECIERHGDLPVYFSDGYFRYGMTCHAESAANFDGPRAMLVKAFSLVSGMNDPCIPSELSTMNGEGDSCHA